MKVLTDKDWIFQAITDGGFLFKSRRFGDELKVKSAKYVLRGLNLVLFCSSPRDGGEERKVTLSRACRNKLDDNQSLSLDLKKLLKSNKEFTVQQVHKLSSQQSSFPKEEKI